MIFKFLLLSLRSIKEYRQITVRNLLLIVHNAVITKKLLYKLVFTN